MPFGISPRGRLAVGGPDSVRRGPTSRAGIAHQTEIVLRLCLHLSEGRSDGRRTGRSRAGLLARRAGPTGGTISPVMEPGSEVRAVAEAVNRLIDENRIRCLWFLRPDYYPATLEERLHLLGHIERHGDREAFRRAATLKRWLSRDSSALSVGS